MALCSSRRKTRLVALLKPREIVALTGPALSEADLADPDRELDAAMDHWIPSTASRETLRQAERRLVNYVAWLQEEASARHPSWAEDEVNRALRRLVELQAAERAARPPMH
jgi:hypothetical protein